MARTQADIRTTFLGSIIRFDALTNKGRAWCKHHRLNDAPLVAEHRYGLDIITAMTAYGLRVQDSATKRFAELP